jgi:hypothetical protein
MKAMIAATRESHDARTQNANPKVQLKQSPSGMKDQRQMASVHAVRQHRMNDSAQTAQLKARAAMLDGSAASAIQKVEDKELLQGKFATIQRAEEEEPLQGKFATIQRVEEDETLQGKSITASTTELAVANSNDSGLPYQLKAGIESLSGMSMDHVKVHYNSDKPAQLNAHAYAQGSDIHVAPGQEQHVPHEAWHVVQQAQGRVKPSMQMKLGVPVNDDAGLETEADVMGARAMRLIAPSLPVLATRSKTDSVTAQLYAYGPGKTREVTVTGKNKTIKFEECLQNSVEYKAGENARDGSVTGSPADWADWVKNNDGTRNATQMHVVNRRWGGLGKQKEGNITPGTPAENSEHSHQVEGVFDQTAFGVAKANGTAAVQGAKYVCYFEPKYGNAVDVSGGDKVFGDPDVWATIEAGGKTEILECGVRGNLTFTDPS